MHLSQKHPQRKIIILCQDTGAQKKVRIDIIFSPNAVSAYYSRPQNDGTDMPVSTLEKTECAGIKYTVANFKYLFERLSTTILYMMFYLRSIVDEPPGWF